jgi:hypothetical protein
MAAWVSAVKQGNFASHSTCSREAEGFFDQKVPQNHTSLTKLRTFLFEMYLNPTAPR